MNYQPLLIVGGGGAIGLAYVMFRDRNKPKVTDSGITPDSGTPATIPTGINAGGYAGAGYNPTVQAPGTVNTGSPASPDPVTPVTPTYPPAPGVPEIVQPISNPSWVDPNNPAWIPTETRPEYDIENRTPQWDPAYRYGPEVTTVNGGTATTGTAGQTFTDPIGGTDPSTTYQGVS